MVEDAVEARDSETYYPWNDEPTRHVFGKRYDDWTLNGRLRDKDLGANQANVKIALLQSMVTSEVVVRWGDVVGGVGLLKKVKPGRESEAEVTYELTIRISRNEYEKRIQRQVAPPSIRDLTDKMVLALSDRWTFLTITPELELSVDFLEFLDDLLSDLNQVTATLVRFANELDNAEQRTAKLFNRIRASVGQAQTALTTLQITVNSIPFDFQVARTGAQSAVAWAAARAQADLDMLVLSALLAETDRRAEIEVLGQNATTHRAQSGDTWDSLSTRFYGGPSGADRLRQANRARYGTQPEPGQAIQIPLDS